MKNNAVSICMAVYNGEKYLEGQLISIINQLSSDDEIIIINDSSSDNSMQVLQKFNYFPQIKIWENEKNLGHIKSFERALGYATNDFVFLSDQDDLWFPGRISLMKKILSERNNINIIATSFKCFNNNYDITDEKLYILNEKDSSKNIKNLASIFTGNIAYFGCAMAMKKEFLTKVLPFPKYIESHDLWIAILGNVTKTIFHLDKTTILHRFHSNNVTTSKRPLLHKLKSRIIFCKSFFEAKRRKKNLL